MLIINCLLELSLAVSDCLSSQLFYVKTVNVSPNWTIKLIHINVVHVFSLLEMNFD